MAVYIGVDYGVRKLALAALPSGGRRGPLGVFSHFWHTRMDPNEVLADVDRVFGTWYDHQWIDASVRIEYPFFAKNARTAVRMGMMAGAIYAAASAYTDDLAFVEPATWKKHVVGRGNADKQATMDHLAATRPRWSFHNDDEADALCMAWFAAQEAS